MKDRFGDGYAHSVAHDQELSALGGKSPAQALADGHSPRKVWHALCDHMGMSAAQRLGPPDVMTPPS